MNLRITLNTAPETLESIKKLLDERTSVAQQVEDALHDLKIIDQRLSLLGVTLSPKDAVAKKEKRKRRTKQEMALARAQKSASS